MSTRQITATQILEDSPSRRAIRVRLESQGFHSSGFARDVWIARSLIADRVGPDHYGFTHLWIPAWKVAEIERDLPYGHRLCTRAATRAA